ncbi:hypothetical protein DPEC_G00285640 [Dallia pectoralis]|uniref:Uncharacterized protein n=1 Tax=Dallia pectoralis TaxID=75939 RepID=A0ACC2FK13_DALPE|nr:hypothetical protein DPEC_G00285640 [Dallia pectoralis]
MVGALSGGAHSSGAADIIEREPGRRLSNVSAGAGSPGNKEGHTPTRPLHRTGMVRVPAVSLTPTDTVGNWVQGPLRPGTERITDSANYSTTDWSRGFN